MLISLGLPETTGARSYQGIQNMNLTHEQIDGAWQHARVMPDADPSVWRQDACGAWMRRDHFGRKDSEFGWRIENISGGGSDAPENLRPIHCRNHYDAANRKPHCAVRADRTGVPPGEYAHPPRNRNV